jgi:plasmid stabilization system protein ParE
MPPAFRIILSPEAGGDLQAIYDYVAQDSPTNAAKLVGRLLDAIESLATFPHRTVAEHRSGKLRYPVRSLPVRPYVVYFRVIDEEQAVRVLSVRHGARRKPREFD